MGSNFMPTLIYDKHIMRIISISDTHGLHNDLEIPNGDVLVHAGDMTSHGRLTQIEDFNKWIGSFPHKHKIAISGNHDWGVNFMNLLGSRNFSIGPLTYPEVKN